MPELANPQTLGPLFEGARLLVCVGPGGVGKTTVAAALGVEATRRGRRPLVLTIDPARRLADALGLDGLDDRIRPVDPAALRALGAPEGATLSAAMLDTKASYDALIARLAVDPERRARILDNAVYRAFSRTLARSHAYVAMERLHDTLGDPRFDLVILDTPPTRSALDILDAPGALLRFLDDRVLRAFVGTVEEAPAGAGSGLAARGAALALRLFGRLVGERIMEELGSFFEAFLHLRAGFAERAEATQAALRAEGTRFLLITAPAATHLHDAAALREGLREREVPLALLVVNRAFSMAPVAALELGDPEPLAEALFGPGASEEERRSLRELLAFVAAETAEEHAQAARIGAFVAEDPSPRLRLPRAEREPCRLEDLAALIEGAR